METLTMEVMALTLLSMAPMGAVALIIWLITQR